MPIRRTSAFLLLLLGPAAPAAEIDKYLPNDSGFILSVNVRQALDSSLVKKYLLDQTRAAFDTDRFRPRQIFQAMQLDPFKDITSLTLAGPRSLDLNRALLIVRGNFDLNTIATVADTEAQRAPETLKVHKEGNFLVYQFRSPHDRSVPAFLCFLDKHTGVLSLSQAAVTEAIARKSDRRQPALSGEMRALLTRVDGRETLWLVGQVTEPLKNALGNNPQTSKLVGALRTVHGGLALADGIQADFRIECGDPRVIGEVRKFLIGIQSLVELAVLGGEWARQADDVLKNAVTITAEKDGVRVQVRASTADIEKLLRAKPTAAK